jgi:hypothetical protein
MMGTAPPLIPVVVATNVDDNMLLTLANQLGYDGENDAFLLQITQPAELDAYTCRAEVQTAAGKLYYLVSNKQFLINNDIAISGKNSLQLVYVNTAGVVVRKTSVATFWVAPSIDAVDTSDTTYQDGLAQLQATAFVNVAIVGSDLVFYNTAGTSVDSEAMLSGPAGPIGPAGPVGPQGPTVYPAAGVAVSSGTAWGTSIDPTTLTYMSQNNPGQLNIGTDGYPNYELLELGGNFVVSKSNLLTLEAADYGGFHNAVVQLKPATNVVLQAWEDGGVTIGSNASATDPGANNLVVQGTVTASNVAALESRVATLEGRIAALEARLGI